MTTQFVHREFNPVPMTYSLRGAASRLLVTILGMFAANAVFAQAATTATFTLQDKTNLPAGTYQIYVTGFSTAGNYILQPDGSWAMPPTPAEPNPPAPVVVTGTLPCYRFPQDISKIQIDGTQTAISARVYYFIVTDTATFPSCAPALANGGLFNVAGAFTYAYTYPYPVTSTSPPPSIAISEPPTTQVSGKVFPAWTYSEIGASSSNGTIDLSQVDFVAFPMNTTATVLAGNPSAIGNPVGQAANPAESVNYQSIRDSYRKFIDAQAASGNSNKTCAEDSTPAACAYLDLLQDITTSTASNAAHQYVIQNPGGYLAQYTATSQTSRLNTVFDGVIAKLWSTTNAPTLVIDTGGKLGSIPRDTFTSSIVTIDYPGVTPAYPVTAMKFTGTATSSNYVAYIVSPADYQAGCAVTPSQPIPPIPSCVNASSTGYQVFAGAGVFGTPGYGTSDQQQVVARLGFLISGAMNRGVALVTCTGLQTWQCWQDETYWYPTKKQASPSDPTSIFPDITQNLFSRWMHTAAIGGTPMFIQPPSAVKSASGTAGGGKLQGMAYGFSNDENPTPTATTPAQPEVPSKFDGTVVYGPGSSSYTITFGPWMASPATPTLTVNNPGGGTVTSSPVGINCGSTCSQSYAAGTTVVLTASPGISGKFGRWTGGCSGTSTTCTVALNAGTTVNAEFEEIGAAAPSKYGLHVVVNGAGTVTSAPSGISCGSACSAAFTANSSVGLSAVAAVGSTFAGWSGACSGAGPMCTVTMSEARTVGAAFVANAHYTLTVTGGTGGIVTTTPGAVDCGTRCIAGFAAGTAVSVLAHPDHGYRFAGWSGACSGTRTCDLTMNANAAVQATFAPIAPGQFSLTVHDYGEGMIASLPPGINCGTACSAAFAYGTEVTLLATPAPGYRFTGWSGACSGASACVVWMDDVANVSALFAPIPIPIPVVTAPIPTLGEWMMALMGLLILGIGCLHLRARGGASKYRSSSYTPAEGTARPRVVPSQGDSSPRIRRSSIRRHDDGSAGSDLRR